MGEPDAADSPGCRVRWLRWTSKIPRWTTCSVRRASIPGNRIIGQHQSMLQTAARGAQRGGAGMLIDLALQAGPARRGHRRAWDEDARHVSARAAACAHRRAHGPGHECPPPRRHLHRDGASPGLTFAPGASYQEITQGCWDFFEPFIRERPELWLWNYKHWRYKPQDAAREYPFYAHPAKRFDQAIARPVGAATEGDGE